MVKYQLRFPTYRRHHPQGCRCSSRYHKIHVSLRMEHELIQQRVVGKSLVRVAHDLEGEKNNKKGGLNCVFGNFFFYVLDNFPQVQSLK